MKKGAILIVMMLFIPVAMAAVNNGPSSAEPSSPEATYTIQQMSFAQAKTLAQQMDDPAINMLMQQMEEYNIPNDHIAYVITSSPTGNNAPVEQLNVTHLLSLGNVSLIFQEIKNATLGLKGKWVTHGIGYGWPPGLHVVRRGEINIFLWYYPSDPSATTIIWIPIFPVPQIFRGPHAGGVVATGWSFFDAPTLNAAPGQVWGWGTFLFGICIPLNGTAPS